jgi:transposase
MTVPGIGPIISSATVAAIGNGAAFSKGRDFGAWLGLVLREDEKRWRTGLPGAGDPNGPLEAWPLMRTHAR